MLTEDRAAAIAAPPSELAFLVLIIFAFAMAACAGDAGQHRALKACPYGITCDVPFELVYSDRASLDGVSFKLHGYYVEADEGLEIEGIGRGDGLLFSSREQALMCNISGSLLVLKGSHAGGSIPMDNGYVSVIGTFARAKSPRFWGDIALNKPMVLLRENEQAVNCMKMPPPLPM